MQLSLPHFIYFSFCYFVLVVSSLGLLIPLCCIHCGLASFGCLLFVTCFIGSTNHPLVTSPPFTHHKPNISCGLSPSPSPSLHLCLCSNRYLGLGLASLFFHSSVLWSPEKCVPFWTQLWCCCEVSPLFVFSQVVD